MVPIDSEFPEEEKRQKNSEKITPSVGVPGFSEIPPMGGNSVLALLAQSLLILMTAHGRYIGKSFFRPLMTPEFLY